MEAKSGSNPTRSARIRSEAEARLNSSFPPDRDIQTLDDVKDLLHELHVHQVELEVQNEELRRAQAEIEESRSRFSALYDFAPVGYVTVNREGRIIEANLTAASLLGAERSLVIGKVLAAFLVPGDRDRLHLHFMAMGRGAGRPGDIGGLELQLLTEGLEARWVMLECRADPEGEAETKGFLVTLADISARVKAEEALRLANDRMEETVRDRTAELSVANAQLLQLDRLKSVFIASMSHELRTPLNAIIGFTGVILQGMAGKITGEQERQLEMVMESAKHLLSLVNEVLDMSKMETGDLVPDIKAFDLADVLSEVRESHMAATGRKGVELTVDAPRPLVVQSDRRLVKQAIASLVANAVDATATGPVGVHAGSVGAMVKVSVKVPGRGTRNEDIPGLFEPFVRTGPRSESIKPGPAMGLYLAKKIALLLGGDVELRSEQGTGRIFTLTLPSGRVPPG